MAEANGWRVRRARLVDVLWPSHPMRWREVPGRLRPTLAEVLRLTSAAVIAWLIARQVTGIALDLTAPLTALLVVQASAYSTVRMGLLRVGAVLTGVLVAVGFSAVAGLSWWSLGAVIAASLLLAKVFRLGEQALEVPISAMLILAVSSPDVAAVSRVALTLVGAGVGVLFNFVLPSAVPSTRAGTAVLRVAYAIADCLDRASRSMAAEQLRHDDVARWSDETRRVSGQVAEASKAVTLVKEGRRLNPRALASADLEPGLREGLDRLEASLLAIRALFTVILAELPKEAEDPASDAGGGGSQRGRATADGPVVTPPVAEPAPLGQAFDEDARLAVSVVLSDIGDCLRAYGRLVNAEAGGDIEQAEEALAESLEILRETRAILTELLTSRPESGVGFWLLRGSVLAAVEQVLVQLDLERRARVRAQWQSRTTLASMVPLVREALPVRRRRSDRG